MIAVKNKGIVGRILRTFFIVAMIFAMYAPIMLLVAYSFTTSKTMGSWNGFSFKLYADMFNNPVIMQALMNSLIVALISSVIATILGTMAAVGIFYMKKYPKAVMEGVSQVTMINADIITGIGFLLFFLAMNIPKGYAALILAHTVICLPYVIMSVMPRLTQLNPNVYEAGLDLGASHTRTFLTVVMPQLVSGMISGFMLSFTISLDDFVISKFINGTVKTIPTYLYDFMVKHGVDPQLRSLSALLLVSVMSILIVINVVAVKRNKKLKNKKVL